MTQPLLLDAPSEPPKSPCQKLIEAHGIKTDWSGWDKNWLALYPLAKHASMDVAEIMAEGCGIYDSLNYLFYGESEEEAVFGLCGQLNLDMKGPLNL